MTTKDTFLSEVFNNENKNISVKIKPFVKRINFCISQCFRKNQIKLTKRNKEAEELFKIRGRVRTKTDEASRAALKHVDKQLSDLCAEENMKQITEACKSLSCETRGVDVQLKKRLRGIKCEPPTAMLDQYSNLVTNSEALEDLTIEMFKQRLQTFKINYGLNMHQVQRENMCTSRRNRAQENKTPD